VLYADPQNATQSPVYLGSPVRLLAVDRLQETRADQVRRAHVSDAALEHDVEPLGVAVVVDAAVPELTFAQSLLDLSLEMQAQFQMQQSPEYPIAVALVGYGKWLLAFRAP
jgi:hypothetical protein